MKKLLEIINNHFGKILLVFVVSAALYLGIISKTDLKYWIDVAVAKIDFKVQINE